METQEVTSNMNKEKNNKVIIVSEEISSRVADCTRLILLKDGFGGDLGALDRCVDERSKDTRILEWFGPPERNTLRPLWSCIGCRSLSVSLVNLRLSF
jgi:hypothetical protein